MSLPFVIVLYALIRDDTGMGGGGTATEQFGDVSEVDISCLHVPFALESQQEWEWEWGRGN